MNDSADKTRVIFMGTPEFAVPSLRALLEVDRREGWEVVAVYTQPDRRAGRGKKVIASPVKQISEVYNVPVYQPARLRKSAEAVEQLEALAPDLIVVAAYGMILPVTILEIPTFGCLNLHASLLPAYRGASPVAAAILDGLSETGNSVMVMEEGLDTGPVLAQETVEIQPDDTTATLTERLAIEGAALLIETLPQWLDGELWPTPQEELAGEPSFCGMIKKSDGAINWHESATMIERMTRAYAPWPSAYTAWRGQPFKILEASVVEGVADPGVVTPTPDGPAVGTGDQLLLLHTVQPAGKRPMTIQTFLNGAPEFVGGSLRSP